jgi:hypothetical protein
MPTAHEKSTLGAPRKLPVRGATNNKRYMGPCFGCDNGLTTVFLEYLCKVGRYLAQGFDKSADSWSEAPKVCARWTVTLHK